MSIPFDPEVIASRMKDAMASAFTDACFRAIEKVEPYCESPIEVLLGASGYLVFKIFYADYFGFCPPDEIDRAASRGLWIPQFQWQGFRIDWVLADKNARQPYVFVECDGHDFHERTKEQAERDRAKDRAIQLAGIPILRFTGREIHRNVNDCLLQIVQMSYGVAKDPGQP